MSGEIDPDECIMKIENLPSGGRIIWRRCPACYQEVYDVEDSLTGFITHLSIHKLKIKQKT
ncbi:MAG: hypothetical protein N3G77_07665 [Nitrososphaeria archaeon]|nr:hypothetical protein [Nitrososphaeria archaeon]